jgi:hypothetical protein
VFRRCEPLNKNEDIPRPFFLQGLPVGHSMANKLVLLVVWGVLVVCSWGEFPYAGWAVDVQGLNLLRQLLRRFGILERLILSCGLITRIPLVLMRLTGQFRSGYDPSRISIGQTELHDLCIWGFEPCPQSRWTHASPYLMQRIDSSCYLCGSLRCRRRARPNFSSSRRNPTRFPIHLQPTLHYNHFSLFRRLER